MSAPDREACDATGQGAQSDRASLAALPAGVTAEHLTSTVSTNADAFARAANGVSGPHWVCADAQTAGRGRGGRRWASLDGNFAASLLVVDEIEPRVLHQAALLAGVALHDAVCAVQSRAHACELAQALRLKWPNDLLLHDAKCAGILAESSRAPACDGNRPAYALVIGFGVNLAAAPRGLAPDPKDAAAPKQVTALADHGLDVTAATLLPHLAAAMDRWLGVWARGAGFPVIRDAWLARGLAMGRAMSVHSEAGTLQGTMAGLDHDGALLLAQADGSVARVTYGDVALA